MMSDLSTQTARALLKLYGDVMNELRHRRILRSSNNPVVDYAESLAAAALKLELAPKSTTGFDATDANGLQYEIKGRRITSHNRSRQLSAIRSINHDHFHFLIGILFREDFSVLRGGVIPACVVKNKASYREHTNAWILHLRDELWETDGVADITKELREAELRLCSAICK